ncbi:hypothetical protein H8L32_26200 [Undibacterium sp. CY18W]|uniref:DUF6916 domain-containing protein n=1 Tax=Undibacterium hunanense TaxID=2762292 RepID=A0ABR6ZYN1_9BURK|nr:hypothetical protein [Undibacterium hunanense]MBC3920983.1 hypothetical protein [Undibacterium hunanense]
MTLSKEQLNAYIGNIFRIETSIGDIELKLEEVDERSRRGLPSHFATPLLLIFSGTGTKLLSQDNYIVHHPEMGQNVWLIAPVMPDYDKGQDKQKHEDGSTCFFYQAFFN